MLVCSKCSKCNMFNDGCDGNSTGCDKWTAITFDDVPERNDDDDAEVKTDDPKAANFVRLAGKRMDKIRNDLRVLGNLAGNNYHYTKEQVNDIEIELQNIIRETMNFFKD